MREHAAFFDFDLLKVHGLLISHRRGTLKMLVRTKLVKYGMF